MYDVNRIREDFPILSREVNKRPLVYLDNGATTQKPRAVLESVNQMSTFWNANIHRGVHYLSQQSTEMYEAARETVRSFLNAASTREIVFTAGATAAINTVAYSFGEKYIKEGDEILITEMEHHANIVPWQLLCQRKGAILKYIPFDSKGILQDNLLESLITEKTKILGLVHVSNSLGTINPVKEIVARAHALGVPVLVDGSQAAPHMEVDVQDIDADFYVFAGHKVYGPTGIGILYGKEKYLEEMPPYQGGGDMIAHVKLDGNTTWAELPLKFEAGTTNYIGAVGLGAAIRYIEEIGLKNIQAHEHSLLHYANQRLSTIGSLTVYGKAPHKAAIISFLLNGIHMLDTGMVLDKLGIAVRTGTHCTEPIMDHFGIDGTVRASFAMYNTKEEVDRLYEALLVVQQMFGGAY
ncbi:cysteine desulfurase [Acetobacteroides hydrogenigenes]|uniref:Probable cysteine desulfurase n=1 Tax=Acetobacteroides hydrogenigenes TaxID=979970 RepID=A0A4V6NLU7_9BACT|nr:cysteine desulfurase [Acetobacteroides hydrogenigenes]TCN63910.1 cysteine desulfurase/selenocysteine lyase [Acetobacteroides hydrogenigenes]